MASLLFLCFFSPNLHAKLCQFCWQRFAAWRRRGFLLLNLLIRSKLGRSHHLFFRSTAPPLELNACYGLVVFFHTWVWCLVVHSVLLRHTFDSSVLLFSLLPFRGVFFLSRTSGSIIRSSLLLPMPVYVCLSHAFVRPKFYFLFSRAPNFSIQNNTRHVHFFNA